MQTEITANSRCPSDPETETWEEREARLEFEAEARMESESEHLDDDREQFREEQDESSKIWTGIEEVPQPTVKARWTLATGWILNPDAEFGRRYADGLKCCGCRSTSKQECEDCDCHINAYYERRAEMRSESLYGGYGGDM